ncbi:MAG: hypothetical protein ACYDAK_13165 [Candidatus Limnocylindrales bacterium]
MSDDHNKHSVLNQLTTDTPHFELVLGAAQLRAHVTIFAEALVFAADGKVETHYGVKPIENISSKSARMRKGASQNQIVMDINETVIHKARAMKGLSMRRNHRCKGTTLCCGR